MDGQRPRTEDHHQRPLTPHRGPRVYHQDYQQHNRLSPSKCIRRLQRQRSSPRYSSFEDRVSAGVGWVMGMRQSTKSPDSGLDCGSEEEGPGGMGYRGGYSYGAGSPMRVGMGPNMRLIHCEGPVERRALAAAGRKRTLTRQSSVDDEFLDAMDRRAAAEQYLGGGYYHPAHHHPHQHPAHHQHYPRPHHHYFHPHPQRRFQSEVRLTDLGRSYYRENRAHSVARLNNRGMDEPLVCVRPTTAVGLLHNSHNTTTTTTSPTLSSPPHLPPLPPQYLSHSSSSSCCSYSSAAFCSPFSKRLKHFSYFLINPAFPLVHLVMYTFF